MRVTNQAAYYQLSNQVMSNLEEYRRLQEMLSTGKQLTKASDDPSGIGHFTNMVIQDSSYQQYKKNVEEAHEFLTATDGALDKVNDLITRARELAEMNATGTINPEANSYAAQEVDELINSAIEIANTKVRDRYIFSGFNTDQQAYSDSGRILNPYSSENNVYDGSLNAEGEYSGITNKDYRIRIVADGGLGFAEYQLSEDGGENWSENRVISSTIDLTNLEGQDTGINLKFTAGQFAVGDDFRIIVEKGRYQGDEGQIEINANRNSKLITNLTGQEVFEESGFFDTMYKLKYALDNSNIVEVSESLEELKSMQLKIEDQVVKAGSRLNRIEIAKNNLEVLHENITGSMSTIEDTDLVDTMSKFTLQDSALQSSMIALSNILPKSLINYI